MGVRLIFFDGISPVVLTRSFVDLSLSCCGGHGLDTLVRFSPFVQTKHPMESVSLVLRCRFSTRLF